MFLDKIFIKKEPVCTVPKKVFRIILPYLGALSHKTQKRIENVFDKVIPWGKINIVYKTQSRISHFFRYKDAMPTHLMSHLIYYYKCSSCNAEYVGETARHAKVRWSEHLGLSCFTENQIVGIRTPVRDHLNEGGCRSSIDDFKILGREENINSLKIKESLFINRLKTKLNTKIACTELALF